MLFSRLISGCPNVSRKISIFELAHIWYDPLTEDDVFVFTTYYTLIWSWWIVIGKLCLLFIPWNITHVSRKTIWKILSHVIISKVLPFYHAVLTCVHEVLEMSHSRNRTFTLGISSRFLHCMSKTFWYITSSILFDE